MRGLRLLEALVASGCTTYDKPYPAWGHGYCLLYSAPAYLPELGAPAARPAAASGRGAPPKRCGDWQRD